MSMADDLARAHAGCAAMVDGKLSGLKDVVLELSRSHMALQLDVQQLRHRVRSLEQKPPVGDPISDAAYNKFRISVEALERLVTSQEVPQ